MGLELNQKLELSNRVSQDILLAFIFLEMVLAHILKTGFLLRSMKLVNYA